MNLHIFNPFHLFPLPHLSVHKPNPPLSYKAASQTVELQNKIHKKMPKHLQKSLQDYLSKIKRETGKIQLSSNSFSSSKNWVLSGCKHPKTPSFAINRRSKSKSKDDENDDSRLAATLSDIDRFLQENFKSLCIREDDDDDEEYNERDRKKNKKKLDDDGDDDNDKFKRACGPALYDSLKPSDTPPVRRKSERLFAATTTTTTRSMSGSSSNSSTAPMLPENCIAVLRYTPDAHEDFRLSMLEMVEARLGLRGTEVDWDFMEELLLCYLHLNDKKSHSFILSAFVDLIIVLRQNEKSINRKGSIRSLSTRIARERLRRRLKRPS